VLHTLGAILQEIHEADNECCLLLRLLTIEKRRAKLCVRLHNLRSLHEIFSIFFACCFLFGSLL
jgi:hypothetical protein